MKIAVVLSGYFDTISIGRINSGIESEKKIKDFLKDHNVDYFIHCWQPEKEQLLRDIYQPLGIICEPQKDFSDIVSLNNLDQSWFDENFDRQNTGYCHATILRSLSFFYSRQKALELLSEQNKYDWVFTMRLDVGTRGPDAVNFPHRFNVLSDNSKIYSVYWEQLNCGLGDMWFVSNQADAKILSNMYNRSLEYYKKDSEYVKLMTNGWPDSEYFHFPTMDGSQDPRQYSNVILFNIKSQDLMKYPKWYCINNHAIYKYFFIESGLYNRTIYI